MKPVSGSAFPKEFGQSVRLLVELGFASRDPIVRGVSPREVLLALAGKQRVPDSEPHDCDILRVEVKGRVQGKSTSGVAQSIVLPHPSWRIAAGSLDTGVPLSIIAQMLARREICTPGVLCPETSVPPEPFFMQLERRGIRVSVQGPKSNVQGLGHETLVPGRSTLDSGL